MHDHLFRRTHRIRKSGVAVFISLLLLAYMLYYMWQLIVFGAGNNAKILCSAVFVSGRASQAVLDNDLTDATDILFDARVDLANRATTASFFGLRKQRAIFREGVGCTLLAGADEAMLRNQLVPERTSVLATQAEPLKRINGEGSGNDSISRVNQTLDHLFTQAVQDHPSQTRAVIILHDGKIIAERYAAGFSSETPLLGYSMTKSVMNALIGILIKQGKLSIDKPLGLEEWSGTGDRRAAITLDQLLRMSSGLEWDGRTGPVNSDINRMLFQTPDMAGYAVRKPLKHSPGTRWKYSSGTSSIIAATVCDAVGGTLADCAGFVREALFARIGMHNAVIEPDASGNLVGGSYMYATARDWARFGLLYLRDGVWNGEQILPKGWVNYTTTPTETHPQGVYGAHFWLNGSPDMDDASRPFPRLPADTFYATGSRGQKVIVIPSYNLVVVHLGWYKPGAWDMAPFIADVLSAFADE